MKKAAHYSSHFPALLWALSHTAGDVLEMGGGLFSTPLLHYFCVPRGRQLVTVDNDQKWLENVCSFEHPLHRLVLTNNWDAADWEQPVGKLWDVVFIDHAPREQRRVDLLRYADRARFIVIHDTNGRQDRHYHLMELWPQFKYAYHYGKFFPQTTIVSNFAPIVDIC